MGLEKLLYLQGVGAEFIDCFGNLVHIPAKDRQGILTTMLLPSSFHEHDHLHGVNESALPPFNVDAFSQQQLSAQQIAARIEQLDVMPWLMPLHGFQWCGVDKPHVDIYLPERYPFTFIITIRGENIDTICISANVNDAVITGEYHINDQRYCQYRLLLNQPNQPLGYYHVSVDFVSDPAKTATLHGQLMVAPSMAYQGRLTQTLTANKQSWGLNAQLYALRNDEQWGIGDFGNLAELIDYAAHGGADFILLNPLHALDISQPDNPSPYSPTDRRRLNPLYIQIEAVYEYNALNEELLSQKWQQKRQVLNQAHLINYDEVQQLKYAAFEKLYQIFCSDHVKHETPRFKDYLAFLEQDKIALMQFVAMELTLASKFFTQDAGFYLYLQFVANEQLQACQLNAKQCGMSIGLIRDLAVGAISHGAEVSANVDLFCDNASIGAPPDPFAEQGQNWGLAPFDPVKLKQHNFSHFIQLVRSNMQSCGALRIDHVMGLLRLWWWPLQENLGHGSYVYYPLETLLAIVCLESQQARCIVIGEDLGIVPPEIVSCLRDAGILSNELFYFCKQHQGFKSPKEHKRQSLMMLANHDVPTLFAWWSGADLRLRRQLELIETDGKLQQLLSQRQLEKQQLVDLLIREHVFELPAPTASVEQLDFDPILLAWISVAAKSNAQLFSMQLSDLVADKHGVNIPGTWKEFPNWQRRLPLSIKQMSQSPKVQQRLEAIASARQSRSHSRSSTSAVNTPSSDKLGH
ncbi:4-alpha-glucanotransferase [Shewanella livingstonensis]|uniref:4-alpha-glucanotransferase n=1 Tax=Shewanella livingstonensis TaxID=150120 RepID=A0A3G8LUG3_9GAMM|nr:4-alpha-glucanotransferase [Shewanella livingstonensis]AZG73127.1 4-alpha-glucanotransferase [Shewanella livingstonensis]